MGTPARTPNAPATSETRLEFADNRLLIDLCGEHDANLARIEHAQGVQILRRGNHLTIIGEATAREETARILNALYARLEAGKPLEPGDIDGAIRLDAAPAASAGPGPEITTRKKTIEPRSPAQAD